MSEHQRQDTYEDILYLPHHEPKLHPRMSMEARAAQFAPFAALTGYEAVIAEAGSRVLEEAERGNDRFEEMP